MTAEDYAVDPLEKVSRVRHLLLFERAPAAYVSGANFLSGSLIGLPRTQSVGCMVRGRLPHRARAPAPAALAPGGTMGVLTEETEEKR